MLISVLLLTGCGNNVVCTMKTIEEDHILEQKIVFEYDDNEKVTNVILNQTMVYDDEQTAENYFNVFTELQKDYDIVLDGKKINITTIKNYEIYDENKNELEEEFESNGYTCK